MDVKIEQSWKNALNCEFEKDYFKNLTDFVRNEYLSGKTKDRQEVVLFRS